MVSKTTFFSDFSHLTGTVVVGFYEGAKMFAAASSLDQQVKGRLSQIIAQESFKAKKRETLLILSPTPNIQQIFCVGMGKEEGCTPQRAQEAGKCVSPLLKKHKIEIFTLIAPEKEMLCLSVHMLHGIACRSWSFTQYKTKNKARIKEVSAHVFTKNVNASKALSQQLACLREGIFAAKNLISEPPNILTPEAFSNHARTLKDHGVKVSVLDKSRMEALGMGALLGVGQGSDHPPYLVTMSWHGGEKNDPPLAFVGKGVCFDSGGISLKPAHNMDEMKADMSGAAAVYGLMKTLALRNAKVNAVGVIGLVENMPSGKAIRPSDVLTSMSGQTIEVLNTDAEGRLVLADALWYTKETFKPKFIIDLATLTGAIVTSLGNVYMGLFSNDDVLAEHLIESSQETGELAWRLPLAEAYDKMLKSLIADVANIATSGTGGGSITAAQFLQRFVGETSWAHLDIAGTAWLKSSRDLDEKGATGVGVSLLNHMVQKFYEK